MIDKIIEQYQDETLCKGDGVDHCGYDTKIECEQCKYGGGRKNPEAKCNTNSELNE